MTDSEGGHRDAHTTREHSHTNANPAEGGVALNRRSQLDPVGDGAPARADGNRLVTDGGQRIDRRTVLKGIGATAGAVSLGAVPSSAAAYDVSEATIIYESTWDEMINEDGTIKEDWDSQPDGTAMGSLYSGGRGGVLNEENDPDSDEFWDIRKNPTDPISGSTVEALAGEYTYYGQINRAQTEDGKSHRAYPVVSDYGDTNDGDMVHARSYFRTCLPDADPVINGDEDTRWFHFISHGPGFWGYLRWNMVANVGGGWRFEAPLSTPPDATRLTSNSEWASRGSRTVYQPLKSDGNGGVTTRENFHHFAEDVWHKLDIMYDHTGKASPNGDRTTLFIWLDDEPWLRAQGGLEFDPKDTSEPCVKKKDGEYKKEANPFCFPYLGNTHWGLYAKGNCTEGTHHTDHEQIWKAPNPVTDITDGPPESPHDGEGYCIDGDGILEGTLKPEDQIVNDGPGRSDGGAKSWTVTACSDSGSSSDEPAYNIGSSSSVDVDGTTFQADPGVDSGSATDSGTSDAIADTDTDALYQSIHYGTSFGYDLPVDSGTYDLTLYFCETYWGGNGNGGGTGSRVFDVSVNGTERISDLDIYDEVGHDTALTRTISGVSPSDGSISVSLSADTDNALLCGLKVAESSSTGDDTTAPNAPSNLSSPATTDTSVDLDWDGVSASDLDYYQVYRDGSEETQVSGSTATTISGLSADTSYDFAVSAVDTAGNESDTSPTVTVTTDTGGDTTSPAVPSNLSSSSQTESSVTLDWDAVSASDLDYYQVYQDGSQAQRIAAGTTSTTVSGLSADTRYDFAVSAVDTAGNESDTSPTVTVTTDAGDDTTAPTTPSNLSAPSQTESSVTLDWDGVSASDLDYYQVYRDGSEETQVSGSTATTVSGLSADTSYDFAVSAVDTAGNESDTSPPITVRTDTSGNSGDSVAAYANDEGIVDARGLLDAAADFRNGEIGSETLLDVAAAFRSEQPVG